MARRLSHPAWLVASLLAAAGIGAVVFFYYWFLATFELFDCVNLISDAPSPPSHIEGGEDSSVYIAAILTGAVWFGAWKLTTSTRLRRCPPLLVPIFIALDVAALLVLWSLAPAIWGSEHCVPDSRVNG
jgi:hypothetical protein